MADELHPGVRRVLDTHGDDLLSTLTDLSAPDFTSLMLAVAGVRAARRSPSDLLRQYAQDRFVAPAAADGAGLRRATDAVVDAATGAGFTEITPSPLVPLGLHSVLGGISQNRLVSTGRSTEVAGDPTNALALEAAVRRRAAPPTATVRLVAVQRVTRAQLAVGPTTFAHFTLAGLVTASRDRGNHDVEVEAMVEHVRLHAATVERLGFAAVRVRVSDLSGRRAQPLGRVLERLTTAGIDAEEWAGRDAGTGYYPGLCFKLHVRDPDGGETEVADGGPVDWTGQLLGNRKERLMISGMGLDRLALAAPG